MVMQFLPVMTGFHTGWLLLFHCVASVALEGRYPSSGSSLVLFASRLWLLHPKPLLRLPSISTIHDRRFHISWHLCLIFNILFLKHNLFQLYDVSAYLTIIHCTYQTVNLGDISVANLTAPASQKNLR